MSDIHLTRIRCRYDAPRVADIGAAVPAELSRPEVAAVLGSLKPGARIAVAVGSRGITNLQGVVRALVGELRLRGARPFIVPAMGSHGGATAEGQIGILREYGITAEGVGAPLVSSMETVELSPAADGTRVFMARDAWEADGTILVNRIKAHTDFHGEYESGLMKMAVIGLGKHSQALEIHGFGVEGLRKRIEPVARSLIASGKILGGLALVENAYDETAHIRFVPAADMPDAERELLALSKRLMPRLPASPLDLLILDEIGKNISGVGMDPNIVGRMRVRGQDEPEYPVVASIIACALTPESHGNALGIGLADLTTRALYDKIDYGATMANAITSTFLERAKIPLIAEHPRQAVEIALRAASVRDPSTARIMRIKNTLSLDELWVSDPLLAELAGRADIEVTDWRSPLFEGDELSHG